MDYYGLHHFGILVENVDEASKAVEALGGRHYLDTTVQGPGGFEVKMYGPEGVLFDVAEHAWTGAEALPAPMKDAAE
jgi:predicted enzyme related to lactoylglutathione lyase